MKISKPILLYNQKDIESNVCSECDYGYCGGGDCGGNDCDCICSGPQDNNIKIIELL